MTIIVRALSVVILILGSVITVGVPLARHLGWIVVLGDVVFVMAILASVVADLADFRSGQVASRRRWAAHVFAWMSAALFVAEAPKFTLAAVLLGVMVGVAWSAGIRGVLPDRPAQAT